MHVLFKIKQRAIYLLRSRRPEADEALSSLAQVSFRLQQPGIKINHIEDYYRHHFIIEISFVSIMHRRSLMISHLPNFQFTSTRKWRMTLHFAGRLVPRFCCMLHVTGITCNRGGHQILIFMD